MSIYDAATPAALRAEVVDIVAGALTKVRGFHHENRPTAQKIVPPVPGDAHTYKGVAYHSGKWWYRAQEYLTVAALLTVTAFTDADHAAIYALKDRAPADEESLENILADCASWHGYTSSHEAVTVSAQRIRAWVSKARIAATLEREG